MRNVILVLTMLLTACSTVSQQQVAIVSDSKGSRLTIDGQPVFLNGMNWDYFPIGTNYAYSLWQQSDDVIRAALDNEMPLLQKMGSTPSGNTRTSRPAGYSISTSSTASTR